jgi:ribosomal subunit interface protein
MNIIVQSKTIALTDALRDFATAQAKKLVKNGHKVGNVMVFLDLVKRRKNDVQSATAKFLVQLPGKSIVVQEHARDMYGAVSSAAQSTLRQLRKTKERRIQRRFRVQPV